MQHLLATAKLFIGCVKVLEYVLLCYCVKYMNMLYIQCACVCVCLCSGAITGHTVRCPWHGACFNVHTGDLEEYPGIDSLPCHKVWADTQTFCSWSHFNWCFLFSFEGQNSKQQSVCFYKQTGQLVNFSFSVFYITSPEVSHTCAREIERFCCLCFMTCVLFTIQSPWKEKRVKSMGTAMPGFHHTVLLLGGGEWVYVVST